MADPVVLTTSLKLTYKSPNDDMYHSLTYDNIKSSLAVERVRTLAAALVDGGYIFKPEISEVVGASLITRTETPYELGE